MEHANGTSQAKNQSVQLINQADRRIVNGTSEVELESHPDGPSGWIVYF